LPIGAKIDLKSKKLRNTGKTCLGGTTLIKIDKTSALSLFSGVVMGMIITIGPVLAEQNKSAETPTADTEATQQANDPLESLNRVTAGFNRIFRKTIADPIISGYQAVTPAPLQKVISNIGSNLTEPVTALSSMLQGDSENAGNAMGRFFINTTIGMAGASDQASGMGMVQRREDLGQAAGAAGTGGGAHIVLPFFGPSNMRDMTGDILTTLINPLHTATSALNAGTSYAENRDQLNSLTDGAMDPYILERDAYEQNRQYRIDNGAAAMSDIPDFEDEDEEAK